MLYVAARTEELGHHPDMHLTWPRVRFVITTHDAGNKLTAADFDLARHIDAIAVARGRRP
jgi:4a-hydroxytetrahydrobiopterin dehydratase